MTQFLGTHKGKLDGKGRVSIPAPFRNVLRPEGVATAPLILRPSHRHACLEGWPLAAFEAFAQPLDALDRFSDARDDLLTALFANAWPMEADKEGRIVLPDELIAHANLTENGGVEFHGRRDSFEIWEAGAGTRRRAVAQANVRALTSRGADA